MANSVDPDQTAPIEQSVHCSYRTVCSGSTLFASILNLSVMLGNYLQQTTFSDAFFLGDLRVTWSAFRELEFKTEKLLYREAFIICLIEYFEAEFIWN